MQRVWKQLKNRSGTLLAEAYPIVLISAIALVTLLTVLPPLFRKNTVDRISNEVARYVEIQGDISVATSEFHRLLAAKKVTLNNPSIRVEGSTIGSTKKIQMDEEFTVIVEYDNIYEIGTIAKIPKRVASKATGRSEKYWK